MIIKLKLIALLLVFVLILSVAGVFATWQYASSDLGLISYVHTQLSPYLVPWNDFPEDQFTVAEQFREVLNSNIDRRRHETGRSRRRAGGGP